VVSDGGCTCPGDFAKAFGAGGDFVMAGGMFAGHAESGGELVEGDDGNMYKEFYGKRYLLSTICLLKLLTD
jgi:GMP reductase